MSSERSSLQAHLGLSTESNTSSSSFSSSRHVIRLKDNSTHILCLLPSENENSERSHPFIRIKISKTPPRHLVGSQMFNQSKLSYSRSRNRDENDNDQQKIRKLPTSETFEPMLATIHKKTDHPSFVILPETKIYCKTNQESIRNKSASENSNETYVIRTKEKKKFVVKDTNPILGSKEMNPTKNNSKAGAASIHGGQGRLGDAAVKRFFEPKSEDFCECVKGTAGDSINKSDKTKKKYKTAPLTLPKMASYCSKNADDLFQNKFVEPNIDSSQRLIAGQESESVENKTCYMYPNFEKVDPLKGSREHSNDNKANKASLNETSGYVKINYKLVLQCLKCTSPNEKCEVLDAISWRMESKDLSVAVKTIQDVVKLDLFGIQCEYKSKSLLEELFWPLSVPRPHPLQTSIARFLNALVSFNIGRDYFNNSSIIHLLTWGSLDRDNIDPLMADNLIGVMTKLSYNRFQCHDMIKNGLLKWLMEHMVDVEYSASRYHLQCMTELMRNLLREKDVLDLSSLEIQKLILILGRYLDVENKIAKQTICDSLLILCQKNEVFKIAKEMNFQRIIGEYIQKTSDRLEKVHLHTIYKALNGSRASRPFKNSKFDYQSKQGPHLVDEFGCEVEVDKYPGECLLREKFSGKNELSALQFDKNNFDQFKPARTDMRKDGKLKSRVFVEHLNCFLPEIEQTRIFPMFKNHYVGKHQTSTHLSDSQSKNQQSFIPPALRIVGLPRSFSKKSLSQQTVGNFIEKARETLSKDDVKSAVMHSDQCDPLENVIQLSPPKHNSTVISTNGTENAYQFLTNASSERTTWVRNDLLKHSGTMADRNDTDDDSTETRKDRLKNHLLSARSIILLTERSMNTKSEKLSAAKSLEESVKLLTVAATASAVNTEKLSKKSVIKSIPQAVRPVETLKDDNFPATAALELLPVIPSSVKTIDADDGLQRQKNLVTEKTNGKNHPQTHLKSSCHLEQIPDVVIALRVIDEILTEKMQKVFSVNNTTFVKSRDMTSISQESMKDYTVVGTESNLIINGISENLLSSRDRTVVSDAHDNEISFDQRKVQTDVVERDKVSCSISMIEPSKKEVIASNIKLLAHSEIDQMNYAKIDQKVLELKQVDTISSTAESKNMKLISELANVTTDIIIDEEKSENGKHRMKHNLMAVCDQDKEISINQSNQRTEAVMESDHFLYLRRKINEKQHAVAPNSKFKVHGVKKSKSFHYFPTFAASLAEETELTKLPFNWKKIDLIHTKIFNHGKINVLCNVSPKFTYSSAIKYQQLGGVVKDNVISKITRFILSKSSIKTRGKLVGKVSKSSKQCVASDRDVADDFKSQLSKLLDIQVIIKGYTVVENEMDTPLMNKTIIGEELPIVDIKKDKSLSSQLLNNLEEPTMINTGMAFTPVRKSAPLVFIYGEQGHDQQVTTELAQSEAIVNVNESWKLSNLVMSSKTTEENIGHLVRSRNLPHFFGGAENDHLLYARSTKKMEDEALGMETIPSLLTTASKSTERELRKSKKCSHAQKVEKKKCKLTHSCCCMKLLNNEKLIDGLCRKVLKKFLTEKDNPLK